MPADSLNVTFAALADPTRRAILARLSLGRATPTELAAPFAISLPAVIKHLGVLERAGLIRRSREAGRRPCSLVASALEDASRWLAQTQGPLSTAAAENLSPSGAADHAPGA